MSKFKVVKRLSLNFLGEGWKDAYINFQVLTIADVKNKFPSLTEIDPDDPTTVIKGMDTILGVLRDKFVDGKGPDSKDLTAKDIEDLPAEVMKRSFDFLAQGLITP